jgi:hypothetical protein
MGETSMSQIQNQKNQKKFNGPFHPTHLFVSSLVVAERKNEVATGLLKA